MKRWRYVFYLSSKSADSLQDSQHTYHVAFPLVAYIPLRLFPSFPPPDDTHFKCYVW